MSRGTIDQALLFGLAALGDTESVLELGHFGKQTHEEAIERMKQARRELQDADLEEEE